MLRNLVSSLLEHEQITTTVAKAKEAQKMAEKLISTAKKGGQANWDRANSILLNPKTTLRPLSENLVPRYASRPGGYTRLTLSGHRVGDRAPLAVLELVDSPNDLKFEQAARVVGREMAIRAQEGAGSLGWWDFQKRIMGSKGREFGETEVEAEVTEGEKGTTGTTTEEVNLEGALERLEESIELQALTRKNVVKALRYRLSAPSPSTTTSTSSADSPLQLFLTRSHLHYLRSLAQFRLSTTPTPDPSRPLTQLTQRIRPSIFRDAPKEVLTVPLTGRRVKAGERTDGWAMVEEEVEGEAKKRGGPITRAKGSKGRYQRRREGTVRNQEDQSVEA